MLELSAVIPEFAGYFLRADGRAQVLLTDPRVEAQAKAAVAEILAARRHDGSVAPEDVEVVAAIVNYTFSELKDWRDRVSDGLWLNDQAGIVSVDLAEHRNRVVIAALPGMEQVAKAAALALDIPDDALVIEEGVYATPDRGRDSKIIGNQLLAHRFDTVMGGIRYRFKDDGDTFICTLGPMVSGGFLTASHCTDAAFSTDSATIWQNSTISADSIGFEELDPDEPLSDGAQCGTRCRWSDASLHTYTASRTHGLALIARPTASDPNQGPLTRDMDYLGFQVDGSYPNPVVGDSAQKVGQSTGWTYGTVTSTCVDTTMDDPESGLWKIKCQDFANYGRQDGDSGAPVFLLEESPHVAIILGVHSGSSGGAV